MNEDSKILYELRRKIFLTGYSASNAHFPSAYSILEILYTLYCKKIMYYNPQIPNLKNRDRLILSKGHGSLALYCVLNHIGFFQDDVLRSFAKPNSVLGGEPTIEIPGVDASTGSLGHGLSIGVGMALALKSDNSEAKVFVILGDGECQEGSVWEAIMSAAKFELDNLIVILDYNKLQKMGSVIDIMGIDNWRGLFWNFGWNVNEVDGHNVEELSKALLQKSESKKPRVIIADTVKGKGISIMESVPNWHWKLPNKKELRVIMEELNLSEEEVELCRKPM